MIYLDHAATTPLDPQVLDAMLPHLRETYGNPSSVHRAGRDAHAALDAARDAIAAAIGATPRELIFTGGGSEADNLAIKGVARARRAAGRGGQVITSAIEHHAVLHAVESLAADGFNIGILPVDTDGLVSADALRAAIGDDTALVSIMHANNEIGTIQPIAELGAICRERGVPFHTDAVQTAGALPLDVGALNVDLLTLAAHKFYGPKGVGLLYARRGVPLDPQIHGGAQERQRRAGTENVAGIVGMAAALQLAEARRDGDAARQTALRDWLIGQIRQIPLTQLAGHATRRLPNNINVIFDGIEGESALLLLDQRGIAASSGSACTSGSLEPSHVILALGIAPERAIGALRFSLGRSTSETDVRALMDALPGIVAQLRSSGRSIHR